jgi:hypothetical protein
MSVPIILDAALPLIRRDGMAVLFANRLVGIEGATVSADSEASGGNMTPDNLLSEMRADYYRSGSVATRAGEATPEIAITWTLGRARGIDFFAYAWSNNLLRWQVELYAGDPEASGVLQAASGWMSPIVRSEVGDLPAGIGPWGLGPSNEKILLLADTMMLSSFVHWSTVYYGITHIRMRIDVSEGSNGPVDYVQISLPFAGELLIPRLPPSLGSSLEPVTTTVRKTTAGGSEVGLWRQNTRQLSLPLNHLTDDEALQVFTDWVSNRGELARVFVCPDNAAAKRRFYYDQAFVATIGESPVASWEQPEGEMDGVTVARAMKTFKIKETR